MEEVWTAEQIATALRADFTNVKTGIAKTGVSALLQPEGASPRAILLRADMDALPIQEESSVDYASKNPGVMHACGHDGHMSILLHTAHAAAADPKGIAGAVRIAFQPAEEGPGGARPMIEEGILDDPPIEAAFAVHMWNSLPIGKIAVAPGPVMASADEFEFIIHGKGGHGALPQETVDAIVVASHLVVALQSLVSRNTDPLKTAVVSVGKLEAGTTFNIIAEKAQLCGTLRTFDADTRAMLIRRMRELGEGICASFGAKCEFNFTEFYPPTVNDPAMAEFTAGIASDIVGKENVIRDLVSMGGEDMSFFLQKVPGAFIFLGSGNQAKGLDHPHHSPHFDFDEDAMLIGAEIFMRIMERYWKAFPEPPARNG